MKHQPLKIEPKPATSPKAHPQHGFSYTAEYRAWQGARKRCTEPKNAAWPRYGGRGITMCDRWLNDVAAFINDMGAKPSPKHELDRIDNNKGYAPGNCRWVERTVNNRNRRGNRLVEWRGQTKTVMEWSELTGLSYATLSSRIKTGWDIERAMTEPAQSNGRRIKAALIVHVEGQA